MQFGASHWRQYLESSSLPSTRTCIAEVGHAFGFLASLALPLLLGRRLGGFALLAYLVDPGLVILFHTFGLPARIAFPLLLGLCLGGCALLAIFVVPGLVLVLLLHLPTCLALLAALARFAQSMLVAKFGRMLCFPTRPTFHRTASCTNVSDG